MVYSGVLLLATGPGYRNCGPPTSESPTQARVFAALGSFFSPVFAEVPMSTPPRLDANALATALAMLPALSPSTTTGLDPVHIALARAIASGQDADQLARDLRLLRVGNP